LTGIAERDARETRVCFTPTGARPAIVTLIAAILSNTNDETRVCQVRARGKRRGVIRARDATSRKKRVWIKANNDSAAHLRQSRKTEYSQKKPRFVCVRSSETPKPATTTKTQSIYESYKELFLFFHDHDFARLRYPRDRR